MPRLPVRIRQAADGSQWITTRELNENIFGSSRRTAADESRRFFGAAVTPEVIEAVLRRAECGYMRDLTDLTKESLFFDPHQMSVAGKRFRALAAVKPKVVAAEGPGVDPTRSAQYADEIRYQLSKIRNLRQQIIRLNWGHFTGRAALEKRWVERRGGAFKYEIDELNWIHARRISLGPVREFRIRDDAWEGTAFAPQGLDIESIPHKFVTYKPQLFDEVVEREGIGPRGLYWSYFKRFSQRERMALMEVFGKPWRILTMAPGSPFTGPDQLDDMQERADELGAYASAAFGPGFKLDLESPDSKATEPHDKIVSLSNDEISKLYLGSTGTTDAKAAGLGSQMSLVHQDSEALVISADGWGIGDCLTWDLSRDFVVLNHGEDEAINAPTIEITYEAAPDQTVEIARAVSVFSMGIPLKTDEVYRRTGWEKPEEGDEVMTQQAQPSAVPGQPGAAKVVPSVVPSEEVPTDGGDGVDPALPLARVAARSLRLSRLSKGYFSGR